MPEKGKFGIFAGTQPCSALMTMPSYDSVVGVPALSAIPAFLEFMLFLTGPAVVNIASVPAVSIDVVVPFAVGFPIVTGLPSILAYMLLLAFLLLLSSCFC
jgi:hypothetical protein